MINLATHPFRNERLPMLLVALAGAVVLGVTAWHAHAAGRLGARGQRHEEVRRLEAELAALRSEAGASRTSAPDPAALARWGVIRDLVDRRTFSWTRLLHQLETSLLPQVRLRSLAPTVDEGIVVLRMSATARPPGMGLEQITVLEAEGPFAQVYPMSVRQTDEGDARYEYELRYRQPEVMVKASPAPPSPAGDTEPPDEDRPEEAAE